MVAEYRTLRTLFGFVQSFLECCIPFYIQKVCAFINPRRTFLSTFGIGIDKKFDNRLLIVDNNNSNGPP